MENCKRNESKITRGIPRIACVTALGMAFTFGLPLAARAQSVTPPPVPPGLEVPAPNHAFLLGRGVGTELHLPAYRCPWARRVDVVHTGGHVVHRSAGATHLAFLQS
jgi:hypothetical protein